MRELSFLKLQQNFEIQYNVALYGCFDTAIKYFDNLIYHYTCTLSEEFAGSRTGIISLNVHSSKKSELSQMQPSKSNKHSP